MNAPGVICPRVSMRMECPECHYPFSEALYLLDEEVPHLGQCCRCKEVRGDTEAIEELEVEVRYLCSRCNNQ